MTKPASDRRVRPHLWHSPLADRKLRRDGSDDLGEAKCPLCKAPLVARLGKKGPYFHCACRRPRAA